MKPSFVAKQNEQFSPAYEGIISSQKSVLLHNLSREFVLCYADENASILLHFFAVMQTHQSTM
jgi:hypothetical protein